MISSAVNPTQITVSETFTSIQGEGPSTGERAVFARLADCNLACTWCDTKYAWNWKAHERAATTTTFTPAEYAREISELADSELRLLVLTGGEPLLQYEAFTEVLEHLRETRPLLRCEVETNGTIPASLGFANRVHRFVVSPKLRNAGGPSHSRVRRNVLERYAQMPQTAFKFVITEANDVDEMQGILDTIGATKSQVWLMPAACTRTEILDRSPQVAELALARGFNFSGRSQLLLWDGERGR